MGRSTANGTGVHDASHIAGPMHPTDTPHPAEAGPAQASAPAATHPSAFVALSRFTIANDMTAEVRKAFINRPHLVDGAPGFLRMEVISPVDAPQEIWLITYWADEHSYREWHRSHSYRDSHHGIPAGLRLDPRGTEIRYFDHICS